MRLFPIYAATLILTSLSLHSAQAQEQLGLKIENYSGIHSVLLNPTAQLSNPQKWNLNIASASLYFQNNYGYIKNTSVPELIRFRHRVINRHDIVADTSKNPDQHLVIDFNNDRATKTGTFQASTMGPSITVKIDNNWTVGFFTNYRVSATVSDLPPSLNFNTVMDPETLSKFSVAPFDVIGMAWGEVGFNVAYKISIDQGTIGIGITAKRLRGNQAFFINNNTTAKINEIDEGVLNIPNIDLSFGYTKQIDTDFNYFRHRNGTGLGLDVGLSYTQVNSRSGYDWKVSASIIDLGKVRFQQNASLHELNPETLFTLATEEFETVESIEEATELLSLKATKDPAASRTGNGFDIWLPTALVLNGDRTLNKNWHVNALVVKNISIGKSSLSRNNLLAVTPRYESRWFGAMMPVSISNRKLRIGFAARLGFLTVGTERIGTYIHAKNFTGSDVYASLSFTPFDPTRVRYKRKRHKRIHCYKFK